MQVGVLSPSGWLEDDKVKITYAVSWLKGTAQRWYEPNLSLNEHDLPQFALHWDTFKDTLKAMFGEPNPVNLATQKLNNLHMLNHHHITKYNIDFNEHSTITGFGKWAPYAKYYKGLAPRIKDSLVNTGWATMLAALHAQAINLDLQYWEHQDEDKYKNLSSTSQQTTNSSSGMTLSASQASSSLHNKPVHASYSRLATPASNPSTPTVSKKTDSWRVKNFL